MIVFVDMRRDGDDGSSLLVASQAGCRYSRRSVDAGKRDTANAFQFAGTVVIFLGLLVFCLALISFSSSWRVGIDTVSPGGLITTGVFSVTRNPIFLSMDLYFLGTFFIYSNPLFLMCFVCVALGFQFQIRQEETFLIERYGDKYRKYMGQVNRYI